MSELSFKHPVPLVFELNKKSDAYRRMTMAGFTFGAPQWHYDFGDSIALRCSFKCVCGREEIFQRLLHDDYMRHMKYDPVFNDGQWDAAQDIENAGAVSVEHLQKDGFSADDIKRIRYIYDLEDEVKKLRAYKQAFMAMNGNYDPL